MSDHPNQPKPKPDAPSAPQKAPPAEAKPPTELTPDEQMENFARQLKEDDWGHQPC